MSLPEPCEAKVVMETKGHQAASSGLESSVGRLSHYHQHRFTGFPGLAGLTPAPHQKKTPSFGGKDVCSTGQSKPGKPAKPGIATISATYS
jgi:hypothetical protein